MVDLLLSLKKIKLSFYSKINILLAVIISEYLLYLLFVFWDLEFWERQNCKYNIYIPGSGMRRLLWNLFPTSSSSVKSISRRYWLRPLWVCFWRRWRPCCSTASVCHAFSFTRRWFLWRWRWFIQGWLELFLYQFNWWIGGVVECWGDGVMEWWSIGQDGMNLFLWQHSNTPVLQHSG